VPTHTTIVVCEGDQTGRELLDAALRTLEPSVIGIELTLERFDLSLRSRERTENGVVFDAAKRMKETGLGLKAATITPTAIGGVGSPNRILREGIDGKVIVRTGRRIPGVTPIVPLSHPVVVVRMAVGDAYGAAEGRDGEASSTGETAWRTVRIERSVCRSVAEFSFRAAASLHGLVYGGPKWTVSPTTKGGSKRRWTRRPPATRG
jgi:isocitrate dehydrogenase (NAD+)